MKFSQGKKFVCIVVFACIFLGCSQVAKRPIERSGKEPSNYDFKSEGKIPPLERKDVRREADVEEIPVLRDTVVVEEVPNTIDSTLAPEKEKEKAPRKMPGYRIQIFASNSSLSAEEIKNDFIARFPVPAYVEYMDGMYKVRVGDFINREEAKKFLSKLKQAGFEDAWVVESLILPKAED